MFSIPFVYSFLLYFRLLDSFVPLQVDRNSQSNKHPLSAEVLKYETTCVQDIYLLDHLFLRCDGLEVRCQYVAG